MALVQGGGGSIKSKPYKRTAEDTAALNEYKKWLNANNASGNLGGVTGKAKTTASRSTATRSTSSSGGGSSAPSSAQKKAAGNLSEIARYNAKSTKDQFNRAIANYDLADKQNKALADVQFDQNSRKGASDRFAQNRKLQSAVSNLRASAGNALQGSGAFNLVDMLRGRTDLDNNEVWSILAQNQNAVRNALDEALNANVVARNNAASDAEFGLRGIEADLAAQRNNIDGSFYVAPGKASSKSSPSSGSLGSTGYARKNLTPAHKAALAGYIMPSIAHQTRRDTSVPAGASYFDRLMGAYAGRR